MKKTGTATIKLASTALAFCLAGAHAALVDPDPTSLLKNKKVLVLAGLSTSHGGARTAASTALGKMKDKIGFTMTIGDSRSVTATYLAGFDIVVFNYFFESQNMTTVSQEAFKTWFASGKKGYIGYHNSGANQDGEWNWYRDNVTSMLYTLHSTSAQQGTINKTTDASILSEPIMKGLDANFTGTDEWYEFEQGATWNQCKVMYYLDESTLKTKLQHPMNPHPMAWYREDPTSKSRYFYTAIIHTPEGAATDFFHNILLRGLEYTAGYQTTSIAAPNGTSMLTWKNLSYITNNRSLRVELPGAYRLSVLSPSGKSLYSVSGEGPKLYSPSALAKPGLYMVKLESGSETTTQKLMVY